tara:strand:+ start:187 stop:495 length:309 start_codon:yes stop_codon:yes gene_type:complete
MSNGNSKTKKKLSKKTMKHIKKQRTLNKKSIDKRNVSGPPYPYIDPVKTNVSGEKERPKLKAGKPKTSPGTIWSSPGNQYQKMKKGGKIKKSNYNGWDIQPS